MQYISFALFILSIIGLWLVFEKAGVKGWKSLIPFYNDYTVLKITDRPKLFLVILGSRILQVISLVVVISTLFSFLTIISMTAYDWKMSAAVGENIGIAVAFVAAALLFILATITSFVVKILMYHGVCKKMGAPTAMVIGIILLPGVFLMILGCGEKYQWNQQIS